MKINGFVRFVWEQQNKTQKTRPKGADTVNKGPRLSEVSTWRGLLFWWQTCELALLALSFHSPDGWIWALSSLARLLEFLPYLPVSVLMWLGSHVFWMRAEAARRNVLPKLIILSAPSRLWKTWKSLDAKRKLNESVCTVSWHFHAPLSLWLFLCQELSTDGHHQEANKCAGSLCKWEFGW